MFESKLTSGLLLKRIYIYIYIYKKVFMYESFFVFFSAVWLRRESRYHHKSLCYEITLMSSFFSSIIISINLK